MTCCPLQQRSNCTAVSVGKTCSRFWNGTYGGPDGSGLEPNKHRMFRHRTRQRRSWLPNEFWNGPPIITMGMGAEGALVAWYADMTLARVVSVHFKHASERSARAGRTPTYTASAVPTENLTLGEGKSN